MRNKIEREKFNPTLKQDYFESLDYVLADNELLFASNHGSFWKFLIEQTVHHTWIISNVHNLQIIPSIFIKFLKWESIFDDAVALTMRQSLQLVIPIWRCSWSSKLVGTEKRNWKCEDKRLGPGDQSVNIISWNYKVIDEEKRS